MINAKHHWPKAGHQAHGVYEYMAAILGLQEITIVAYEPQVHPYDLQKTFGEIEHEWVITPDKAGNWSNQILNKIDDLRSGELCEIENEKPRLCLAISDKVKTRNGHSGQLVMLDMEYWFYGFDQLADAIRFSYEDLKHFGFAVLKSGKSYHVITKVVETDPNRWLDTMIASGIPGVGSGLKVDERWLLRTLYRRAAFLRLTECIRKPMCPVLYSWTKQFLMPLPGWQPDWYEPQNDDLPF